MNGRPTLTDCDEAGDYVVPNVLSPRDLVFRQHGRNFTTHTYGRIALGRRRLDQKLPADGAGNVL